MWRFKSWILAIRSNKIFENPFKVGKLVYGHKTPSKKFYLQKPPLHFLNKKTPSSNKHL